PGVTQTRSDARALGAFLPILLPFAVLALPLLDMLLAVTRRMRAGLSPFHADRAHLHHRLLRLGHTHRRAVLTMYLWTAVLAFGAAFLAIFPASDVVVFLGIGLVVALGLTVLGPRVRWRRRKGIRSSSVSRHVAQNGKDAARNR
ncbi:MAG: hypothetical protein FWG16_08755, partial [Micrococcales bacterium]|nr:hypothetical protein [Micrococcales bacterium]